MAAMEPHIARDGALLRALAALVALLLLASPGRSALAQDSPSEDTALTDLLARLSSEDPEIQQDALTAIVALGDVAAPALETLIADTSASPRERSGAAFALGRIGADSSRAVLQGLWEAGLERLGSGLAMQVAVALAEYGDLEPLRTVLEAGNEVLAAKAAVQLGLRGDQEALGALGEAWDQYPRMRPFFAIALGLLGDARGEDVLREGLRAPELRNHCAVALAVVGDASNLRFDLQFALEDPDPLVRLRALEALIALDPSNLDELLAQAGEDPDARVRAAAEEASRGRRRPRRAR